MPWELSRLRIALAQQQLPDSKWAADTHTSDNRTDQCTSSIQSIPNWADLPSRVVPPTSRAVPLTSRAVPPTVFSGFCLRMPKGQFSPDCDESSSNCLNRNKTHCTSALENGKLQTSLHSTAPQAVREKAQEIVGHVYMKHLLLRYRTGRSRFLWKDISRSSNTNCTLRAQLLYSEGGTRIGQARMGTAISSDTAVA